MLKSNKEKSRNPPIKSDVVCYGRWLRALVVKHLNHKHIDFNARWISLLDVEDSSGLKINLNKS